MTDWVADLTAEMNELFTTPWDERRGYVIPETDDVALKNGAVKIDATFLYADLAASSKLAQLCPWETTAKIIRSYLHCSIKLIKAWKGEIRSFDGDRVMGIFIGDSKNLYAVNCAREIFWTTEHIIDALAKKQFGSVQKNDLRIRQCVGVDTGTAVAVRAGIRNNNDLIWIGRAPSLAAKLSDVRDYPYCVFISDDCLKALPDSAKHENGKGIWEVRSMNFGGASVTVHRTNWTKRP